jgi:hypothetical protein
MGFKRRQESFESEHHIFLIGIAAGLDGSVSMLLAYSAIKIM